MLDNIKNPIGSIFKPKFDIDKEIALLEEEVTTIADISEMANTVGYQRYKKWILDKVDGYSEQILRLSGNVELNKEEITKKYWLCDFLRSQIRAIDMCLALESNKVNKLKHLTEIRDRYGKSASV